MSHDQVKGVGGAGTRCPEAGAPPPHCRALWHCSIVALWHCGIVALWHCGIVALWHCGIVALWHCGIPYCATISLRRVLPPAAPRESDCCREAACRFPPVPAPGELVWECHNATMPQCHNEVAIGGLRGTSRPAAREKPTATDSRLAHTAHCGIVALSHSLLRDHLLAGVSCPRQRRESLNAAARRHSLFPHHFVAVCPGTAAANCLDSSCRPHWL